MSGRYGQHYFCNHGDTLPEEKLNRIFEQFYRLGAAKYKQWRAGLGLAIAKQIVRHNGTIVAESQRIKTSFRLLCRWRRKIVNLHKKKGGISYEQSRKYGLLFWYNKVSDRGSYFFVYSIRRNDEVALKKTNAAIFLFCFLYFTLSACSAIGQTDENNLTDSATSQKKNGISCTRNNYSNRFNAKRLLFRQYRLLFPHRKWHI